MNGKVKKNQHFKPKKQLGMGGLGIIELLLVIGFIAALATKFVLPMLSQKTESEMAAEITHGITLITQAAYDSECGTVNDYSTCDFDSLTNFLPQGFSRRASNGKDYGFSAAPSNPTKFVVSIDVEDERVLSRIKSKLKTGQYSVSGTTFSVTGP